MTTSRPSCVGRPGGIRGSGGLPIRGAGKVTLRVARLGARRLPCCTSIAASVSLAGASPFKTLGS